MAEQSDFTPAQSELHQFWLDTWHERFHCGKYTPDDVAQTMFHVAMAVWQSRHDGPGETARLTYLMALRFAALAGIGLEPEAAEAERQQRTTAH